MWYSSPRTLLCAGYTRTAAEGLYDVDCARSILLLVERGLLARERIRWSVRRPRCALGDVTELDDVGIRPVTPVLSILALGLALSLIFLSFELASSKYKNR